MGDLRPMRASLFTFRRLYYRPIIFIRLQVNVPRTIGILRDVENIASEYNSNEQ